MDFRGKKHERGSNWSDPEVVELLQLWSDDSVQIELESCLRNQHVFNRIAEVMRGKGIFRTGDQCREKIKKLKLEYRRIKDNQKTMRGGRTWKFYDVMDRVLSNRPSLSYSTLGGNVIAHQVLPGTVTDAYLPSHSATAFGNATSGAFLFNHPPKPGELLDIKREDVNSDDGLLSSDVAAPPELLYHIGSEDEPDADSKSVGPDVEDFTDMGRGEGATHTGLSPSGFSDQNVAGSSGTGVSMAAGPGVKDRGVHGDHDGPRSSAPQRQKKRRRAGRGGGGSGGRGLLDEALVTFLNWQRAAEERLLALEEARLEKEVQAEERRERQEERRAEQEREHELRVLSMLASAFGRGGGTRGPAPQGSTGPVPTSPGPLCDLPTGSDPPTAPAVPFPQGGPQIPQNDPYLSRRGNRLLQQPLVLDEGFFCYHADKYEENSNPNGVISMGPSENKLCFDLLEKRLMQPDMFHLDPALLEYSECRGRAFLREELVKFLTHFGQSRNPLKAECVVAMNSCASLFSALSAVLCEREDAMLIPSPCYGAIIEDIQYYSEVQLYYVDLDSQPGPGEDRPFHLSVDKLERALMRARKEGVRVRALILLNPHNPLGDIYTPQEMTSFLEFAKKHELHVIVDEIYMLSVFDEAASFHSVFSFERLPDPQRTHVMWGMSKDFTLAGMNMGTLYTENKALAEALELLARFHSVAGPTQYQLAQLLRDHDWISREYLPENRRRLRAAHGYVTQELRTLGIPYLHRGVGFYIWADFSKYLKEPSFADELSLWRCFLKHKVLLSCGQAFNCCSPGWFRIVFTDKMHRLQLGMERIRETLKEQRASIAAGPAAGAGESRQEGPSQTEAEPTQDNSTGEGSVAPGTQPQEGADGDHAKADGISLADEDFVVSDCQAGPEKLDDLIGALRQQIRSSDWLEKNRPELAAGEDPSQLDVFKDLLNRARK